MLTTNKYLFLFLFAFIAIASIFYLKCYESFSSASKNYLYTAVMIEPREHPAFEFVMTNFLQNLNDDWGFVIFHGTKNKEYVDVLFITLAGRLRADRFLNLMLLTPLAFSILGLIYPFSFT